MTKPHFFYSIYEDTLGAAERLAPFFTEAAMAFRIGTRGSALALKQTHMVMDALKERFPENDYEIVVVKTVGDAVRDRPMKDVGTTGLFTRELEQQLLEGKIDFAVHSMKDMPARVPDALVLHSVLERANPRDALICREAKSLDALPLGAVVGTDSLRRIFSLRILRPDLQFVSIRGNIDTRLRKLREENLDAIVLAAAGLERMGFHDAVTQLLSPEEMIPAPAQGILGAEYRQGDEAAAKMLHAICCETTETACRCERAFLAALNVGCHMPVGAYCETDGKTYSMRAMFGSEDGSDLRFASAEGTDEKVLLTEIMRPFQEKAKEVEL